MAVNKPICPPATIGILGGGQLGRMIALEARAMGYGIAVLDPTPNCPTAQIADHHIVATYDDPIAAKKLAAVSDLVTYEFENVSAKTAAQLEQGSSLPQGYRLLATIQNRLREKQAIEAAGVKVAPYVAVNSVNDLEIGISKLGLPVVLKSADGGYDGKGQLVIHNATDITAANNMFLESDQTWVLEKFINFNKELSVIVARNERGEIQTYPVVENIHRHNILFITMAPAQITTKITEQAQVIASSLAEHFNLVGLLAIELFLVETGDLIVNEVAPRPHNSGHFSQQGCHTSQFEQHVRAVCGLPLASPKLIHPVMMINILGQHLDQVLSAFPSFPANWKLHLYGKSKTRPWRKMGHINILTNDFKTTLKQLKEINIWDMEGITLCSK